LKLCEGEAHACTEKKASQQLFSQEIDGREDPGQWRSDEFGEKGYEESTDEGSRHNTGEFQVIKAGPTCTMMKDIVYGLKIEAFFHFCVRTCYTVNEY
jgi:hypothetical protein